MTSCIRVSSLAGEVIELPLCVGCEVSDLKVAISVSAWDIPCIFQSLTRIGCPKVLEDSEQVVEGDYSLAVDLRQAERRLQGSSNDEQITVLQALSKLGKCNGLAAIDLAVKHLIRADAAVRQIACEVIEQLSRQGSIDIMCVLASSFEQIENTDSADSVACEAQCSLIRLMSQLGQRDDQRIIGFICTQLDPWDTDLYRESVKALLRLTSKGNQHTLSLLFNMLKDDKAGALEPLGLIAQNGDRQALAVVGGYLHNVSELIRCRAVHVFAKLMDADHVSTLIQKMEDEHKDVRVAVASEVRQLVEPCSKHAVSAVCSGLQHENEHVREVAVEVLASIAEAGDETCIRALTSVLADACFYVQYKALETLVRIARRENHHVISASLANIQQEDSNARCTALSALAKFGRRGDQRIIAVCMNCAVDWDDDVRQQTAATLGRLAERHDMHVTSTVQGLVHDTSLRVRTAALRAYGCLVQKSDMEAIIAIGAFLEDEEEMQIAALDALAMVASKGDQQAISTITPLLMAGRWSQTGDVEIKAMKLLLRLTEPGDRHAIAALRVQLDLLERENSRLRSVAACCLAQVADKGDETMISALQERLKDSSFKVRCAATLAVASLSEPDCQSVITMLIPQLQDRNYRVRLVAAQALGQFASGGDHRITGSLHALVQDADELVRWAALQGLSYKVIGNSMTEKANENGHCLASLHALNQLLKYGTWEVIDEVDRWLHDKDERTRILSVEKFCGYARHGDQGAICAAAAMLEDESREVRMAAMNALATLSYNADYYAIEAVGSRLVHWDVRVRKAAAKSLEMLAQRGDKVAIGVILDAFNHEGCHVREESVNMLQDFIEHGDRNAILALCSLLKDKESTVRVLAMRGLIQLADEGDDMVLVILRAIGADNGNPLQDVANKAIHELLGR